MPRLAHIGLAAAIALTVALPIGAQTEPVEPAAPPATQPPAAPLVEPPAMDAAMLAPTGDDPVQLNEVRVSLAATRGNRAAGELLFSPDNLGLRISGRITGLRAGATHGFHVHENGDCSAPDASSAGDHFNPEGVPHGRPGGDRHHAGDLPNIVADDGGNAEVDLRLDRLTLGDEGEFDVLGKAVVVHAGADDYSSQPAGDAGARIACGVIAQAPAIDPADDADDADAED